MITEHDLENLRRKLDEYQEEVRGNDDILSGLIAHLVRQIDADMTQLWFYGKALRARRLQPSDFNKNRCSHCGVEFDYVLAPQDIKPGLMCRNCAIANHVGVPVTCGQCFPATL